MKQLVISFRALYLFLTPSTSAIDSLQLMKELDELSAATANRVKD